MQEDDDETISLFYSGKEESGDNIVVENVENPPIDRSGPSGGQVAKGKRVNKKNENTAAVSKKPKPNDDASDNDDNEENNGDNEQEEDDEDEEDNSGNGDKQYTVKSVNCSQSDCDAKLPNLAFLYAHL